VLADIAEMPSSATSHPMLNFLARIVHPLLARRLGGVPASLLRSDG
jgi:hypothetical protein